MGPEAELPRREGPRAPPVIGVRRPAVVTADLRCSRNGVRALRATGRPSTGQPSPARSGPESGPEVDAAPAIAALRLLLPVGVALAVGVGCSGSARESATGSGQDLGTPGARRQPGTGMGIYTPEQHDLYDGRFRISGRRIFQVGALADESPWDHMGDDAANLREVGGSIEIDVDEINNTGTFRAELELPEGSYLVELERVVEFDPCQDGGIAAFLHEHGDAGCGDANWPKSLLYIAGWGTGSAFLNGEPLHEDYQIHFMVTQGMRDRETLAVRPRAAGSAAGAVNPAAQQLDFYIRSPERNDANHPDREVFDHFFAMEVTWK